MKMIEMMIDMAQMMLRTEQMARMHPERSQRDATDRESPKPRCRNVATPTVENQDTRGKAKPRLRRNRSLCSSCRSVDSCANLNRSYSSDYDWISELLCDDHVRFTMYFSFQNNFSFPLTCCHGYIFPFRTCSCFLPFIFNAHTDQTLNPSVRAQ